MRAAILLLILFFAVNSAFSKDEITHQGTKTSCDCKDAVPITIGFPTFYGPTQAPKSFGQVQEITTSDKNSELSFTEEHNSAWYLLTIEFDGELAFDIKPTDTTDDYDFLLYPYRDETFCSRLLAKEVSPVRSNIVANTPVNNGGLTGLSASATQSFRGQGKGNPYSTPLHVKKGEKYMLVLDNITPGGKGHVLYFYNLQKVEIAGTVLNEDSQPVVADVIMADQKGMEVLRTKTDAKGNYEIGATIRPNNDYSITFANDSSFIGTRIINTKYLKNGDRKFKDVRTVLPKLKKGAKYPLGNINFYGGVAVLIPQSYPSVQAMFRLMEKNKKMVILIEGHVNGCGGGGVALRESYPGDFQDLSNARATTVRSSLVNNGIEPGRISVIGRAARQMLFPNANTEEEQQANRRVEIKVISVNGD